MKKGILILAAVMIILTMSSALASTPYELDAKFLEQLSYDVRVNWNRTIENDGTFVTIRESAVINGKKCELTIIGYTYEAYQVCLTVPFKKLVMYNNGLFSDELYVYNAAYYLAMDETPKNDEPLGIFSSYEIQDCVNNAAPYYGSSLSDGWEWLSKKSGNLKVRRSEYPNVYIIEARVLNDGTLYFNFEK